MTSDNPSMPPYGEGSPYSPQPEAGAQPPPPADIPPEPTQQVQPPQPPKKRSALRNTLIVAGSVVGLFIVLAVIGAIVGPKSATAAGHTSTPATPDIRRRGHGDAARRQHGGRRVPR